MLTKLQLKNWRSLRDVSIDFTPITVLIGANSSGKTNIVEALNFLRQMVKENAPEAVYFQGQQQRIRNLNAAENEPVEIDFTFEPAPNIPISYALTMQPEGKETKFIERVTDANGASLKAVNGHGTTWFKDGSQGDIGYGGNFDGTPSLIIANGRFPTEPSEAPIRHTYDFVTQRWQILRENFLPPSRLSSDEYRDNYIIDTRAQNVANMLEFMQQRHQAIYESLQEDLALLLQHVAKLNTKRDEAEIRVSIDEKPLAGREAPTISAGTSRLIAMLTAYHALDMRNADQPGLVVIEEPDTAIHPLLLGNFVDLLRGYTEREQPRQFILTTHNPQMLNYFEPEEVRVVERDPETGETWVDPVPDHLRETWLTEHRLGEAWTSRIIGGIPD